MPKLTIGIETEVQGRWVYEIRVEEDGLPYDYTVTLSWSDYDLWCHGRLPPERVVRRLLEFLLARQPVAKLPPKFDCSLVRRLFPEVDRELAGKL